MPGPCERPTPARCLDLGHRDEILPQWNAANANRRGRRPVPRCGWRRQPSNARQDRRWRLQRRWRAGNAEKPDREFRPPRDFRPQRTGRDLGMLDQHDAFRAEPAREPSRKTITRDIPAPRNVLFPAYHLGWRPDRHPACAQHVPDCRRRCRAPQRHSEMREGTAVLIDGEHRHLMGSAIVEAHPGLRRAHGVGKGTTAGHQHYTARAILDGIDPILEEGREGVASAELEDRRTARAAHSLCSIRLPCRGRIKSTHSAASASVSPTSMPTPPGPTSSFRPASLHSRRADGEAPGRQRVRRASRETRDVPAPR